MSKPARSGLGTISRDWSSSSMGPKSSQEIPWEPTQPKAQANSARTLTGIDQRMRDIQRAMADCQNNKPSAPLVESRRIVNKRPSGEGIEQDNATKKRRVLPWGDDPLSKSGFGNDSIVSADQKKPKNSAPAPSSSSGIFQSSKKNVASVFLSPEQNYVLSLIKRGDSVFYTGSAGTGKSVLLREMIKSLRMQHRRPELIAITASTGIAACNIGGVTLHSFAGIGLGHEAAPELASKVRKNSKAMKRWLQTKVLVIDEVSMVDGELFDKLSTIAGIIRKSKEPFGGIQLIVTGDFFQLPPVTKRGEVKFAFEAEKWKESVKWSYNLTKVFRQSDQRFVDMLNEMRFGTLSEKSIQEFRRLSRPIYYDDGMEATELFPMREEVERSNTSRMNRLTTQEARFTALDGGKITDLNQRQKMLANFMAPQSLLLKIGAQVMLIKNADETLVNGSIGRVEAFMDPSEYAKVAVDSATGVVGGGSSSLTSAKKGAPSIAKQYPVINFLLPNGGNRTVIILPEIFKVELPNGEIQVSRTQLPLILSWAMSIHKSQGQTLDRVKVDLAKVFEKGQAYVALSRATSLEGLQVLNFSPAKVQVHHKVVEWSKTLSVVTEEDIASLKSSKIKSKGP